MAKVKFMEPRHMQCDNCKLMICGLENICVGVYWNDIIVRVWKLSGWWHNVECMVEEETEDLVKQEVIFGSFVICIHIPQQLHRHCEIQNVHTFCISQCLHSCWVRQEDTCDIMYYSACLHKCDQKWERDLHQMRKPAHYEGLL
jgi:hypothetical protein